MIDIVDLEAGTERSRVGSAEAHAARVRYHVLRRIPKHDLGAAVYKYRKDVFLERVVVG